MSLDGFNTGRATITGIGAGQGTLRLPATATAISIGGDFGQPDQVIAKNKTTNILEWDFVSDLSIPDHSIAGVKLKTDIAFDTTGSIGMNNLRVGTVNDPTIKNDQYDGSDATIDITQDPTRVIERFSVRKTDGSATYLTASSGLGAGGNPAVYLTDAPLRVDYTTGSYSAQIGTATASGILQGANTTHRLSLKNTDFSDISNLFGNHEFGDCAFESIVVGGLKDGVARDPGQLIFKDRQTDFNNLVMTSGNNAGARIQFRDGGTLEVANTTSGGPYPYAILCRGQLRIDGDSGTNGILKFMNSNDKLEGHSSGTETTNLNLHDPSNQTPINYQAYQFVQLADSSLPMGIIEIVASGPATVGGLTYFYPMTYDGDASVGGNENFVVISIDGKAGQRYFKICLKGYFGWEEENLVDLGIGQFYVQLASEPNTSNYYPNSLFRVGITNRGMRGLDIALDGTHYCEYEYIYDYGAPLEEDTTIDFYPEFANSFNSNPTGTTTTSDLYIIGGIGGGVSAASPYWYSTTESIPYNPINTPKGEVVDLEGLDDINMEGYPEMP
tara:strand:- start:794 stop:2464 length:1671 start_codon:yes stop_codon:yes gene_type:complete